MKLVRVLSRVLGPVGLLLTCVMFYTTRSDPTPQMYSSFCVDERGGVYSVGAHHRFALNGQLLGCTEEGWAPSPNLAGQETDTTLGAQPRPVPRADGHR